MPKTLTERLQDDEDNILDRRQISIDSRKQLAEYIENDNFKEAFSYLFNIVVGEEIYEYPPTRNVIGSVMPSESVIEELNGRRLRIETSLGEEGRGTTISSSESSYTYRDLKENKYSFDIVKPNIVYEYDENDIEKTEYEIDSIDISIEFESVEVDTTETEFGEDVVGPDVIIESIEIGDEL